MGVQPDSFVAVALERSAEMLIGLLGIWKAGGAYLPLDPSYPAQRLQFMLGDAEAPILLTQSSLVDSLPDHNAHILCLDTDWDTIAQQPETMPESRVTGDHLAYIIYTSGSTGRPKGVQIRHQALANLLTGMKDDPGITPDDKLLAITTLSFDIATVELYFASARRCASGGGAANGRYRPPTPHQPAPKRSHHPDASHACHLADARRR
ncbi:MAG: AMP-binding protein [Chloroflexi bacterium]|nr:AMP-binding protein [Chloroflexota bacterium]